MRGAAVRPLDRGRPGDERLRTVGVLGTMVWDTIDFAAERVERWGGIAYSLAGASAVLPEGWSARPIIKVGQDLAGPAWTFLRRLPGLDLTGGVVETPSANNRVHLVYRDAEDRTEVLTGGVSPWSWTELEPHLHGLDALYINFISGFELRLETARRLRARSRQPIYADLHSLLLDVEEGGRRLPRRLERAEEWLACFDVVQVNERELSLLAGDADPDAFARHAVEAGLGAMFVTRGARGASWVSRGDRTGPWRDAEPERGGVESGTVGPSARAIPGDPTGCGDVWGVTCFIALLAGASIGTAVDRANRAAGAKLRHRGAEALRERLREVS